MEKDWKNGLLGSKSSIQKLADGTRRLSQEMDRISSAKQLIRQLEDNSTARLIKDLNCNSDRLKEFSQPIKNLASIKIPSLAIDPGMLASANSAKALVAGLVIPNNELARFSFPSVTIAPDILALAHSAKSLAESFVVPSFSQIESLIDQIRIPHYPLALQGVMLQSQALESAMKSIQTPWLNSLDIARSVAGFSELQNIGSIVRGLPSFDDRLVKILRVDLGDWSDPIVWPENIFEDTSQRSKFYEDRGFNSALTDFPVAAFHEGLSVAGLLVELKGDFEDSLLEDDSLSRSRVVFSRLHQFETAIRQFIQKQMVSAFGESWVKQRIPGDMKAGWENKREKARDAGEPERPIIEYADFTDYQKIIVRKDNWDAVFGVIFIRQTSIQESLQRLYPIRIATMHARSVTQDDEIYLWAETRRILIAIGFER